jgi:hypothetical protein
MFSNQTQKKSGQRRQARRGQTGKRRLYSIAAWPEQRAFVGNLSPVGTDHKFSYTPLRADAINKLLQLTGRLTVTDARGRARALNSVRATLANTQGGVGTGPLRRQMIASDAPIGDQTTSQQKQQVAGETEKQAGEKQGEQPRARGSMPVTENTGPTSYCGVLYFHFEPLDAGALGVTADLTKVQLNVRLEPLDDTARMLHGLYCYVVDALYGERSDEKLAAAAISELNRVFAG